MNQQRIGIVERHFTKLNPEEILALIARMESDGTRDLLLAQCETALRLGRDYGDPTPLVGYPGPETAPEPAHYNIYLTSYGQKKIQVIKAVREITNMDLKRAKALVDAAGTGAKQFLCSHYSREEVRKAEVALKEAGAEFYVQAVY